MFSASLTNENCIAVSIYDLRKFAAKEIFVAVFAKTIVFVPTAFTNANNFAAMIKNFPSFRSIILALLTEFGIVVAVVAKKLGRDFAGARNAKPIGSDRENLEVVGMVVANGNLGVEVRV